MRNKINGQRVHPGIATPDGTGAGPANHTGRQLQTATQLVNPNWVNVPNSSGAKLMIIPMTGTCGFYRLVY